MQTVVDRAVLLQQVSDYAVQQLLCQMQERLEHLENTLAAMAAAGSEQADGECAPRRVQRSQARRVRDDDDGIGDRAP